jgi:hypothetical protein
VKEGYVLAGIGIGKELVLSKGITQKGKGAGRLIG